jgi:putative lipoprotein
MKSRVLALVLAAFVSSAGADSDPWFAKDKYQHFGASAVLGLASSAVIEDKKTAFAVAMVPGILKEVYDAHHRDKHTPSWRDLAWDAAGAWVGVHVGNLMIGPRWVRWQIKF